MMVFQSLRSSKCVALVLAVLAPLACATPAPPAGPDPLLDGPVPQTTSDTGMPARSSNFIAVRAKSAVQGIIVGSVVGGQIAGLHGAAAGSTLFALYGLVSGKPFFSGRPHPLGDRPPGAATTDAALDREVDEEIERLEALEEERRKAERERTLSAPEQEPDGAPFVREERVENGEPVIVRMLDADGDGHADLEIVSDARTGERIRRAEDTNYDGALDVSTLYRDGEVYARSEDTDHDGQPDRWIDYEGGEPIRVASSAP